MRIPIIPPLCAGRVAPEVRTRLSRGLRSDESARAKGAVLTTVVATTLLLRLGAAWVQAEDGALAIRTPHATRLARPLRTRAVAPATRLAARLIMLALPHVPRPSTGMVGLGAVETAGTGVADAVLRPPRSRHVNIRRSGLGIHLGGAGGRATTLVIRAWPTLRRPLAGGRLVRRVEVRRPAGMLLAVRLRLRRLFGATGARTP